MNQAYPSNLTPEQFELLRPLIPPAKPGGRPRSVEIWDILNAIFYVLCEGCRWRSLPHDFPNWQTVYTYVRNWRMDGTWVQMHDRLHQWVRVDEQRETSPSEVVIDSQSVKTAAMVSEQVGFRCRKTDQGSQTVLNGRYVGVSAARVCDSRKYW